MGIFTFHPFGKPSLACGLADNTFDHQVIPGSIDFKEGERLEIVYSEVGRRTKPVGKKENVVDAVFSMVIFGSTPELVGQSFQKLCEVVQNERGGLLEYRPIGFTTARSTFYLYLKSPLPRVQTQALSVPSMEYRTQTGKESDRYSLICEVTLKINPIATSSPYQPVDIVGTTQLYSVQEANKSNTIFVDGNNFPTCMGVYPIIRISNTGSSPIYKFLLHVRRANGNTSLDWIEAEGFSGWDTFSDNTASGGSCKRTQVETKMSKTLSTELDSSYFGLVTPIISARVMAGNIFDLYLGIETGTEAVQRTRRVRVSSQDWRLYTFPDDLNLPPVPLPRYYGDSTDPTLAQYIMPSTKVSLQSSIVQSAGGYVYVDFVILPVTSHWIGFLYTDGVPLQSGGNSALVIDSFSDSVYLEQASAMSGVWAYRSLPLGDLVLGREKYKIRFVGLLQNDKIDVTTTFNVTIKGIYFTVYPFYD